MSALIDREVLYKLHIHLADDEWGNALMAQLAAEALADASYSACQPLVVSVNEHAGWSLEFALVDGSPTVVGSANDWAVFQGDAKRFRDRYWQAEVRHAGCVWREAKRPMLNLKPNTIIHVKAAKLRAAFSDVRCGQSMAAMAVMRLVDF